MIKTHVYHVCIIESPLQLINCCEYLHASNINFDKCQFFFINITGENNYKQVLDTAKILKVDLNILFSKNLKSNILVHLVVYRLRKELYGFTCNSVIVGDYHSLTTRILLNNIISRKYIVVDDGNSAILLQDNFLRGINLFKINRFIKPLYRLLNLNVNEIKKDKIVFFTKYRSSNNLNFLKNDSHLLKKMVSGANVNERIYFIGNNLAELGVVEESQYLNYLLNVKHGFLKDKKVLYLPHRRENVNKINKVIEQTSWQLGVSNLPFELNLISLGVPAGIITFFSSVIDNVKELNIPTKLYSVKIDEQYILKNKQKISLIYKEYRETGIQIIDV